MNEFHYHLACLCERSYHEKTVDRHGVEVLIEEWGGMQTITPRGTKITAQNFIDLLRDIWITRYKACGMRGHEGMLRGAESVLGLVLENIDKSKPVHVQGHSLGGGISIPLAVMLDAMGYNVNGLVTFGCPLVLSKGHELLEKIPVTQYWYANDILKTLQFWSGRKHIDVTQIGPPCAKNWLLHRTWGDHKIELYKAALGDFSNA